MRIRWTKYTFHQPSRFSEQDFLRARLYPGEFRRIHWRAVRPALSVTAWRVAGIGAIVWLAVTEFETGSLNDSPILAWFLVVLGFGALVSLTLSSLSFLLYAADFLLYWERVIRIASHHDDV